MQAAPRRHETGKMPFSRQSAQSLLLARAGSLPSFPGWVLTVSNSLTAGAVDVLARGDANLVAYLRHVAETSDGGGVRETAGVLAFAGGHNYPGTFTNGVIRIGATAQASPAEVLATADDHFRPMSRGYVVWIRDHLDRDLEAACVAAGLFLRPPDEGLPGIAIDHTIEMPPYNPDARLERVQDEAAARAYLGIVAAGWNVADLPFELQERVLFSITSLNSPKVAAFVAYLEDEPVSGCMTYVSDGCAGLFWAATLPAARGSGLGKATFAAACRAGFEMGAVCSTAQASQMGVPIWRRMGFDVPTHYKRYLAKPPR
jgi:GNAT superfamily N-acetyltransferase